MRKLAPKPSVQKGGILCLPISIPDRLSKRLERLIDRMTAQTTRRIKRLFKADDYAGDYGMDANIGSQARIELNRLRDEWDSMFSKIAGPTVADMIRQVDKSSAFSLSSSLKESAAKDLSLSTDLITPEMREMFTASANEASALIRTIPSKYLDEVGGSVMRSITSGNGLAELVPMLEQHNVAIKNWAKNTALDQTRKAFTNTNAARLKKLGMKKFEWIHSGGGLHPRKLHQEMSGKVYEFDNPPFIGVMYNERIHGLPSTLPNCKCQMRVIVDFGD